MIRSPSSAGGAATPDGTSCATAGVASCKVDVELCRPGSGGSEINRYRCDCSGGTWRCTVVTRRGNICPDAGPDAASLTHCGRLGGTCEPLGGKSPGLACTRDVPNAIVLGGGACDGNCCLTPDATGNLPPELNGYGLCGNVVCLLGPGAICYRGVDSLWCDLPPAGDAGQAADGGDAGSPGATPCGLVACAPPLTCVDLPRSRCK